MANPLTFVRPFRHHTIRSVLLVQSAPMELTVRVAARLRELFTGCTIHAVVREDARGATMDGEFASVLVVRWEDRLQVLRQLRQRRWDAVVVPTSSRGSDFLRVLPVLLRTRAILVFNDHLDYFPLHAKRLASFAQHLHGDASVGGLVRWIFGRMILAVVTTAVLLGSVARIEARAAWRRVRSHE